MRVDVDIRKGGSMSQDTLQIAGNSAEPPGSDTDMDGPVESPGAVEEIGPSPDPSQNGKVFSFAEMLVESGLLSAEQARAAQETARDEHVPLWRVLVRDGLVLSRDLATLIALHLGISMVDLRNQTIEPEALTLLPEPVARKYGILPIQAVDGRLTVAMADPTDLRMIQDLAARTARLIEPVVATSEDILEHIDLSYRLSEDMVEEGAGVLRVADGQVTAQSLRDAPPAQIIEFFLQQALQDRSSDIHIEPSEANLRIRFRIDGILHEVATLPLSLHPTIISRLKIMAGMNIAERRRPQDGQFTAEIGPRKVDVRVAVCGTVTGEMAVLRLLDKGFTLFGLTELGMSDEGLEQYRRLLMLPYGMIIVCGPTGGGKSTTLYASLLQMDRKERKVLSLEDPVEYRIADVSQMQVHPEAGITFASQLRSSLRLDPDVIMVGEIRDQETAGIAVQAALTGHLVLTSLHANDAVAALVRLRDLQVAPYLIASSVAGIVSQRMVRVICTGCQSVTNRPLAEQKVYAAVMGETREQFIYGSGCNVCAHTGYRGRTGVFETLVMSDTIRRLFLADGSREDLRDEALKEGLVPLRQVGMRKVKEGVTTPYEVMRVLFSLD